MDGRCHIKTLACKSDLTPVYALVFVNTQDGENLAGMLSPTTSPKKVIVSAVFAIIGKSARWAA